MLRNHVALLVLLAGAAPALGQPVVTFENATLAQPLAGPNTFQNGETLNPSGSFTTGGARFNNQYTRFSPTADAYSGWAYSDVQNLTTPGFQNQYAAYNVPGGGSGANNSANYGVAYSFSPGDATIDLAPGTRPVSASLTNTTYAALSIQNGDQFAKKFGGPSGNDADFFNVNIRGSNAAGAATGVVSFALADYRFADNSKDYIISEWTTVDLSSLSADTTRLSFDFESSDVGAFGVNTPTYVALDNLVLTPVPEPMGIGLLAATGLVLARGRRWLSL